MLNILFIYIIKKFESEIKTEPFAAFLVLILPYTTFKMQLFFIFFQNAGDQSFPIWNIFCGMLYDVCGLSAWFFTIWSLLAQPMHIGLKIAFGVLAIVLCYTFNPILMLIFTFFHIFSLYGRTDFPSDKLALQSILVCLLIAALLHG